MSIVSFIAAYAKIKSAAPGLKFLLSNLASDLVEAKRWFCQSFREYERSPKAQDHIM